MTFTTVPLSKAIAEHEPYVLPLAPHASVAQQEQWENQLQQLLLTKRRTLQANLAVRSLAPSTTASCGYSAGIYTGGVYYNEDLNMEIDYNVSSDCKSVYLSTVAVYAGYVPYNNPVWWPEFAYAAYKNVCTTYLPVEFVPYTNYSYHPNQWHTSGYYGIFTFENGTYPQCTFGGGGPWTNVAVGPVD